jgi:hypothetical protein
VFDRAFDSLGKILHGSFKDWDSEMIRVTEVSARLGVGVWATCGSIIP